MITSVCVICMYYFRRNFRTTIVRFSCAKKTSGVVKIPLRTTRYVSDNSDLGITKLFCIGLQLLIFGFLTALSVISRYNVTNVGYKLIVVFLWT